MLKGALFVVAILALLLAAVSPARAELAWKHQAVDLRADAKSTVLEARFPFTNTGNAPVDITRVESSCGCTVVTLEKRHYEPRESGEIVARYTVGTQVGLQKKTVEVGTNDGREPIILTLNIQIPEVLRIQPAFVTWKHGETPAAKTITLEMLQDTPVKDVSVQSTAVGFVAEVKPLVPGRKYEVAVHPLATDQHNFTTLVIRCRIGDEERTFRAYANVRPADLRD